MLKRDESTDPSVPACPYCAAGMGMSARPGYHWTGNPNPPKCEAVKTEADIYRAHDADPAKVLAERDHFQQAWQTASREKAELQARLDHLNVEASELSREVALLKVEAQARDAELRELVDAAKASVAAMSVAARGSGIEAPTMGRYAARLRTALVPFRPQEAK